MAENAELDGDLFELLVNICLDRMNDRSYQVRAQAAKASGRLQNTKDLDDLITKRNCSLKRIRPLTEQHSPSSLQV